MSFAEIASIAFVFVIDVGSANNKVGEKGAETNKKVQRVRRDER